MEPTNDNALPLDIRRKKLQFRAWHRGMKEMDIILGNFADRHLDAFDAPQLDSFEMLLHVPDQAFYSMLVHGADVPAEIDGPMFRRIFEFAKAPLSAP